MKNQVRKMMEDLLLDSEGVDIAGMEIEAIEKIEDTDFLSRDCALVVSFGNGAVFTVTIQPANARANYESEDENEDEEDDGSFAYAAKINNIK